MIWNWWGVPGVLVWILAWLAAAVALRAAPRRRLNRQLAAVLFLEGLYGVGNFGLLFFVTDPDIAAVFARLGAVAMATLPLQYLVFLGVSLLTPITRPLRSRPGREVIAAALQPVQRLADRLVTVAMPGVRLDDTYLDSRRRDVLRSAIEAAWADAQLTEEERGLLRLLRERLEVDERTASELEAGVLGDLGLRPAKRAF